MDESLSGSKEYRISYYDEPLDWRHIRLSFTRRNLIPALVILLMASFALQPSSESCALLYDGKKAGFKSELDALLGTDKMVNLLFSRIPQASANNVEAHAEIYRYIEQQMSETLKKYYAKLLA